MDLYLYRAAMAFRKALDLELRRKTGVIFGQWNSVTSSATASTIQLGKTISEVLNSGFATKST